MTKVLVKQSIRFLKALSSCHADHRCRCCLWAIMADTPPRPVPRGKRTDDKAESQGRALNVNLAHTRSHAHDQFQHEAGNPADEQYCPAACLAAASVRCRSSGRRTLKPDQGLKRPFFVRVADDNSDEKNETVPFGTRPEWSPGCAEE